MNGKLDYTYLLSLLSDTAFEYCRELLYPMLNFNILSVNDVRRIDICERINDLTIDSKKNKVYGIALRQNVTDTSLSDYVNSLKREILFVQCEQNSRADKYSKYAQNIIIPRIQKEKEPYQDLYTLFTIYIGLMRELYSSNDLTREDISKICLDICEDDLKLIQKMYRHPKAEWFDLLVKPQTEVKQAKDRLFINNLVFYCLLLELRGKHIKEKQHD